MRFSSEHEYSEFAKDHNNRARRMTLGGIIEVCAAFISLAIGLTVGIRTNFPYYSKYLFMIPLAMLFHGCKLLTEGRHMRGFE